MPWRADFEWGPTEDAAGTPPPGFVEAFVASMPARYAVLFDPRSIRKHGAISFRRGNRRAHAEIWRTLPDGSAALCVVAEDRPGLLSAIAAALVLHRLDVLTALVFTRPVRERETEAVDLLWVRRASQGDTAPVEADEAGSIGEVLSAILAGTIQVEHIAAQASGAPQVDSARVVVRFDAVDAVDLAPLLVEAPDRPGMLLTITLELFQQGAQIVRSLVRTADGRAFNRFELAEFNGGELTAERREQIANAVFAALTLTASPRPHV